MIAILTDVEGSQTRATILETHTKTMPGLGGVGETSITLYEFETEDPRSVPASYMLELPTGELKEVDLLLTRALPTGAAYAVGVTAETHPAPEGLPELETRETVTV